jgi:hypothetical protein
MVEDCVLVGFFELGAQGLDLFLALLDAALVGFKHAVCVNDFVKRELAHLFDELAFGDVVLQSL